MRSLWLASAAFCMTAGVAMAQTTGSSPAPTGAPNAAMASPAPGASPGNMAPSSGGSSSAMPAGPAASSGGMSSGSMSSSSPTPPAATGGMTAGSASTVATAPHYNGQNSVSPPAGQANAMGSSSGTMGADSTGMKPSSSGQMAATHVDSAMAHTAMSGGGYMALPENAEPGTYLRIASKAIGQHNKMLADDALSHAETRMLDRAVPASSGATADDSPGVTAIEHARQALASGDYNTAASDTRMAMHNRHGMMGGAGMGSGSDTTPMSGSGAMGGPAQ